MTPVHLAFKAYDVHELGCHFVARHQGLYERAGLQVTLVDSTFLDDDALPPHTFHAACGAALAAWLNGADRRVVFVAAQRPMFWLYAGPGCEELAALQGQNVAGYPAAAPPAMFLREIWAGQSLPADALHVTAARDDVARLGLLCDGSAAAALLSSAVAPATLARLGYRLLLCLGDAVTVATTGLAVAPAFCREVPEVVRAMCACYREALAIIHADPQAAAQALEAALPVTGSDATDLANLLPSFYTRAGRVALERLAQGAEGLAGALQIQGSRPVSELYDFSWLPDGSA